MDERLYIPFWKGEQVFEESVVLVKGDGLPEGRLLFPPKEILSVVGYDGSVSYPDFCPGRLFPAVYDGRDDARKGGGGKTGAFFDGRHRLYGDDGHREISDQGHVHRRQASGALDGFARL